MYICIYSVYVLYLREFVLVFMCVCVLYTLWRIVSPLVVGSQLSLQTEQMSLNSPALLNTDRKSNI